MLGGCGGQSEGRWSRANGIFVTSRGIPANSLLCSATGHDSPSRFHVFLFAGSGLDKRGRRLGPRVCVHAPSRHLCPPRFPAAQRPARRAGLGSPRHRDRPLLDRSSRRAASAGGCIPTASHLGQPSPEVARPGTAKSSGAASWSLLFINRVFVQRFPRSVSCSAAPGFSSWTQSHPSVFRRESGGSVSSSTRRWRPRGFLSLPGDKL